jgi:hypothetical protein
MLQQWLISICGAAAGDNVTIWWLARDVLSYVDEGSAIHSVRSILMSPISPLMSSRDSTEVDKIPYGWHRQKSLRSGDRT